MTATTARRGGPVSRLPALVGYVFRACLPPGRLAAIALPCAAAAASGLLARLVEDSEDFAHVANIAIFGLALPLGALVIGDAVVGAEVRAGTFALSWATPARFWELVVSRWLGGWVIALATLVPAAGLAALVAGSGDDLVPIVAGAAAGTAGHVALFVAVGVLTRRAAVWSLAIVFLVERLLGAALSAIAQVSPTWLGRAVYVGLADAGDDLVRGGVPHGGGAIVRTAIVVAVLLVVATAGVRRLRLAGVRD